MYLILQPAANPGNTPLAFNGARGEAFDKALGTADEHDKQRNCCKEQAGKLRAVIRTVGIGQALDKDRYRVKAFVVNKYKRYQVAVPGPEEN